MFDFWFFFNSILLGAGLAMDAFSASLANGLAEPKMRRGKMLLIATVFASFQGLMPLIGWFCVHTAAEKFSFFEKFIPWIAMILLGFIGGKMLFEGIREYRCRKGGGENCPVPKKLTLVSLLVQGIATSIDALSVGFTISSHGALEASVAALIIASVTFGICLAGVYIGRRFGTVLTGISSILGGSILIFIGAEILITSFF